MEEAEKELYKHYNNLYYRCRHFGVAPMQCVYAYHWRCLFVDLYTASAID